MNTRSAPASALASGYGVGPDLSHVPLDGRILLNAGKLKGLRKERGISQESLAELCFSQQLCVSIASIKRAEMGKPVLYRTARHLANVFDVQLGELAVVAAVADTAERPAVPGHTEMSMQLPGVYALSMDLDRYVLELRFHLRVPGDDASHLQLAMQLINEFGGVVVQQTDSQMCVHFGFPKAYRSDGERALQCAFALLQAACVQPGHSLFLGLALGGTGSEKSSMLVGNNTVPEADASITIYVAHGLVTQLAARFDFAGPSVPYAAYQQCQGQRALTTATQDLLVGRTIEVSQFKAVIETTHECQDTHIVYLRGMAGIGKTRLLLEFADLARQAGFACHHAEVHDFGMENWQAPLTQLLCSLLHIAGVYRCRRQDQALQQALKLALQASALPEESKSFLLILAGGAVDSRAMRQYTAMSVEERHLATIQALRLLLLQQALRQPLLISIEDLHWADAHFLHVLAELVAASDEAAIVWVLSSRPERDPLENNLLPHWTRALSVLDLAPLRTRDAMLLAEKHAGVEAAYRALCVDKAQGNPLYLTQLLASPEQSLPDSLRHLIQARIDRLPAADQQALYLAAVVGRQFELTILRKVLGQADYLPQGMVFQSLLRETQIGVYVFVHDLVMRSIYESIPPAQRESLHYRIALAYSKLDLLLHAQHLLRAHHPAAFDALLAAIRDSLHHYQYENALELAQQCEQFPDQADSSFTLALLSGHARAGCGQNEAARLHFQRAMMLAQTPGQKLDVALGLAPVLNTLDSLDEEEQLINISLPLARQQEADAAVALLLYLKGNIYFPRGDYQRCRNYQEEALHYARQSHIVETEARAISGIGDSLYAEGRMQDAHAVFEQCVQLCRQHQLLHVEAANLSARASTSIYLGQPRRALQDAIDATALARKAGSLRTEVFSRLTASWVLVATAQTAAARVELDFILSTARRMGARRFEAIALEGCARLAFHEGEQDSARAFITEAVALVERHHLQRFIGPWVWGSYALISEDLQLSQQAMAQASLQLDQNCLAHNGLRYHLAAAELSLLAGDFSGAQDHAQKMGQFASTACAWVSHHQTLITVLAAALQSSEAHASLAWQEMQDQASQLGYVMTMPRLARHLEKIGGGCLC
ncbi:AAA family ATPase [Undibacterium sp. JH2W]